MKRYLLPEKGEFYKANLHAHTTVSDGKYSPEEIKKLYFGEGYSIVAYTDHEVFVPHRELTDENFVALSAVEIHSYGKYDKCYHVNYYAKNPQTEIIPLFNEDNVWIKEALNKVSKEQFKYKYDRGFGINDLNRQIKIAAESGFLACFNHPVWSLNTPEDYIGVENLWGVEVYNTGCNINGYCENAQPMFDMARKCPRLMPVCSDDNHLDYDMFGGFSMLKMRELSYENVIRAMEKGDMYSSSGPLIEELYFEDGFVCIKSSPAVSITVVTDARFRAYASDKDGKLTQARLDISKYIERAKNPDYRPNTPYIRVEVRDASGEIAYTRGYTLDELI